jgi:hypothetical protein
MTNKRTFKINNFLLFIDASHQDYFP